MTWKEILGKRNNEPFATGDAPDPEPRPTLGRERMPGPLEPQPPKYYRLGASQEEIDRRPPGPIERETKFYRLGDSQEEIDRKRMPGPLPEPKPKFYRLGETKEDEE